MLTMYTVMIEDTAAKPRFEEIYHGYRKQMMLVAYRVLGNMSDAEDAVQNALLGIARHMDRLPSNNEKMVRAYVLTAARNAALSMLPGKRQRDSQVDIDELHAAGEEDLFRRVAASEDYEGLLRAMGQLEPRYREVLMLVYVHEHSVREAAAILQRKEGTVRQQLNRGKKLLIELCRKEGILDEWA